MTAKVGVMQENMKCVSKFLFHPSDKRGAVALCGLFRVGANNIHVSRRHMRLTLIRPNQIVNVLS